MYERVIRLADDVYLFHTAKLSDEIKSGEDWQAFQLAMHTYTQSRKTQDDIGVALDKLEQKWSAIEGKFLPKRSGRWKNV